jgi:hypothetical protein
MIGPYTYDARTGRYRSAAGRFVRAAQVKEVQLATFDRGADRALALAKRLQSGEITLAEWQLGMAAEIKSATLLAAAHANGGWAALSPADYGRVGQWLAHGPTGGRGQYEYLRAFAREIQAGLPLDGRFLRRARMYVLQANQYFERERARANGIRGFDQVRSIRHAADSCEGCIEQASRGWQDREAYVWPGGRDCLTACRCSTTHRNSSTGDIAA